MFYVRVNKNSITVVRKDIITAGSVNVYPVKFEFNSADWNGLIRIAIFKNEEKAIQYVLDKTNLVQIPWELMTKVGGKIFVGVCGHNGNEIVLPTQWASCGQVVEGAHYIHDSGSDPKPPPSGESLGNVIAELNKLKKSIPIPITTEELLDILTKEGEQNG